MRLAEIEARIVRIPLRKPIRHASHSRTETDNLIVRVTLDDGTVGFGEGVPREYVTGETAESAIELLKRSMLEQQFAAGFHHFQETVAAAERFHVAAVAGDDRACQGNAARCALELAWLDACGRYFGEPLMNVTRLVEPELYEPYAEVRYSGVIMSASGWKARVMGWAMWLYGFRQVKVKVGISGQDDATRLAVIRRRVGPKIDLRVDANEAWSAAEAVRKIRELEAFGISSVEQPVPHEEAAELARIRQEVRVPIMLDESLCSEVDAERAIRQGLCQLFNLRLSKCGGLIPSLKLAAQARRHGLGYQLGCQVGETAILSAAGRHFACSVRDIRYLEGSYDRHLVRNWLAQEDITFHRGGRAPMLVGSGLGITIDEAKLQAATIRKERLLG